MKPKMWQVAVVGLGILAAGYFIYTLATADSGLKQPSHITLIDVTSGDLYELDLKKTRVIFPARAPDSGEIRLIPVSKNDSGSWYVRPADLRLLGAITAKVTAINPQTGEVITQVGQPKPYHFPGSN